MAAGGAGLAPEERAELLCVLALDKDEGISERAQHALVSCRVEDLLAALKLPEAAPELFRHCAENLAGHPGTADAMAENPACPAEYLVQVAPYLKDAVNALVEDLDRLSSTPGLVTALVPCAHLTAQQRTALEEIGEDDELDEAALARSVESLASMEPDKGKRLSLFQRVARMRVVERMQLALKGNREERMLLIRDPNKLVQRAVLQSPKLTDQEVDSFASMTSLGEEVLRRIGTNRAFVKNYAVLRNIVFNPKAPLDLTLQLMQRLLQQDLKNLCSNKNVPETLRSTALKLNRQRSATKPGAGGG